MWAACWTARTRGRALYWCGWVLDREKGRRSGLGQEGIKIRVLHMDQWVSRPTPGPPLPLGEVVLIQVFVRLGRIAGSYLDRTWIAVQVNFCM
jgi:hypothetical protein